MTILIYDLMEEWDRVAEAEANEIVDCPSCGGGWYMDIEPDTGCPYTCFYCGNGSIILRKYEVQDSLFVSC